MSPTSKKWARPPDRGRIAIRAAFYLGPKMAYLLCKSGKQSIEKLSNNPGPNDPLYPFVVLKYYV